MDSGLIAALREYGIALSDPSEGLSAIDLLARNAAEEVNLD